jgi:hypothetical protein
MASGGKRKGAGRPPAPRITTIKAFEVEYLLSAVMQRAAADQGVSLSEWVRKLAVKEVNRMYEGIDVAQELLDAFLKSEDFFKGCVLATKATWHLDGGYSVELLPEEERWRVVPSASLFQAVERGLSVSLPVIDDHAYQDLVVSGSYTEEEYFQVAFENDREDLVKYVCDVFADGLIGEGEGND